MKDKWFERGGFLYDITKEYGRLRKFEDDIIHNPSNYKDHLNCYEDGLLCNLGDDGKEYITCRFPSSDDDNNIGDFHTRFTWHKKSDLKKILEKNNKKPDELISFVNTNFIYKLPDDWEKDENLLMRYIVSQWGAGNKEGKTQQAYKLYWPENEQLHYPIFEIIKNYPKYNGWEYVPEASSSAVKWLLQEPNSKNTLTTDIASSKFSLPFPEQFKNSIKFEHKDATDDFLKELKRKPNEIMESLELTEEATALLRVLYTIGNIIPAGANFSPCGEDKNDTLHAKLAAIKEALNLSEKERVDKKNAAEGKEKESQIKNDEAAVLLLERLEYFKDSNEPEDAKWNKFIKDHYLQDFVKKENDNYTDPIKIDNPADLAKRIIQRGYRIYYQYERDNDGNIKYKDGQPKINSKLFNNNYSFTDYSKGYLAAIFESVGIPDDNLNLI